MIEPEFIRALHDRPSEELRQIMAHCAGVCAHRDGDGGAQIADALERVAARLRYQPRKKA